MEQIINLKGEDIRYNIKKSRRARRIRLTMRPNCQLTVTIPRRANIELVERFMKDKARWIIEKLEFFRKNAVPLIGEQGGEYRQHKKWLKNLSRSGSVIIIGYMVLLMAK